ncbi:ATP synthase F1 subunit gamma [Buchnera aphidicola]|uniref:ATP synthase gamma chain n=1 Tax=Buchnera aphidicola (Therioaphis trifolii) TaxID=1241884 RepID=A0A4D6YLT7_9GAMM|nr:ATP synthase F1 subunit gamma [Buchnera aphidicola]QCI27020.1 ATP synthase F1 subunit gamma [Buchnera aphidicola (Therioaphis trifolii)]
MANTKIIRNKILSIKNTQKITKTMEMVAISKMKKIKIKSLISLPYLNSLKKIISHFFDGQLQYQHIFLKKKPILKKVGIIILSSNRGLCGNLNNYIFNKVVSIIKKYHNKNIVCDLYIFGMKGFLFFNENYHTNIKKFINYNDNITYIKLISLVEKIITCYKRHDIDKLFIVGNKFNNKNESTSYIFQILPLKSEFFKDSEYTTYHYWDYLYEPDSKITLNFVLYRYILFQIFQCILENMICEQSSRMLIMKTATDNSENIIQELQLLYNKIRQYSITQEIMEIVSGASIIN